MKAKIIYGLGTIFTFLIILVSCTEEDYSLGDLTAPSNIVINTEIVGQDADNPDGDGSGDVIVSVTADNALGYKIDFGTSSEVNLVPFSGVATKKYTSTGLNDYRITVVAFGKGGSSSNITKDISVRSDFNPDPQIITDLTDDASKTWVVDNSVAGHLGVGPWNPSSIYPEWWAGGVDEKVGCCNCFYTATFTFVFVPASGTFRLDVATPDGAFTKTGSLAGIPGIPASGDEGCYAFGGGTSAFSFVPASSGVADTAPSTQTSIQLAGANTFIGYGATQKEYEILVITPTYMYLRAQGTETGNAWYLKLVPAQ
jgi:hypothetical protein